jgi:tellurite methyltransferase
VFFAELGSQVTGLDSSREGLEKAARLATGRNVSVRWVQEALPRLPIDGPFDLVYSCGSLHYVAREERALLFQRLHRLVAPGGCHAHVVFTDRHIHAEKGEVVDYFAPGELRALFDGWTVLASREGLISCAGDGTPHVHSVEEVFVRCGGEAA